MPHLEVRHDDGRVEKCDLDVEGQVLVGRQAPADIVVAGGGPDAVYCRFMRRKNSCEATSVAEQGIEHNGKRVRKATLNAGDVVRVGKAEFTWVDEANRPAPRSAAAPRPPAPLRSDESRLIDELVNLTEDESQPVLASEPPPSIWSKLLSGPGRKRPGEQELIKSPLVMGLGIGTALLLLIGGTLYFILNRESAQRQWNAAQAKLEAGQYAEAITAFEQFQKEWPGDSRLAEARTKIATALVDQAVAGSSPDWDSGLKQLSEYITQYRDTKEFQPPDSPQRTFVLDTAVKISLGAAKSAAASGKRDWLKASADGQQVFERFSPEKAVERVQELEQARADALQAIVKYETYTSARAKIDEALKADKTILAIREYKLLLQKHADFATNRPLRDDLAKALKKEQALSPREPLNVDAATTERPAVGPPALMFARRQRDRSDRSSIGDTIMAAADDSVIGLDSVSGDPVFRRVVGSDPGFFPVAVTVTLPAWLICDARHKELVLAARRDGALQWRQSLPATPAGPPLIHEGQVYLPLADGLLVQIDLATGKLAAKVKFRQKIGGQPVLSATGERLFVFGHESLLYVLTRRPLACERAVYLGHGPGAIVAPLVPLRNYLLIPENDRVDSCRLRLFKVQPETQPPVEIDVERVAGHVHEPCLVRGRELFVPSSPERITAFSVTETDDDKALAQIAEQQVPSPEPSRMYLSAGPDGQLWLASTGLRKFQLGKNSLLAEGPTLAAGMTSQPMQTLGDALFVGRRLRHSRAVFVTEAERQKMVGEWHTTVGGVVLACTAGPETGPLCVTSAGDVFRITPEQLSTGGFDIQPNGTVLGDEAAKPAATAPPKPAAPADAEAPPPAPAAKTDPLQPLHAVRLIDGSVAVWRGGPEPRLVHVGGTQIARVLPITEALQADPINLAGGWLLPLAGKLRLAFRPGKPVHDWIAEIGAGKQSTWKAVVRVDEQYAIAVNSLGRVTRVQVTEADPPHVAEVAHWDSPAAIDLPPIVTPAGIVLVDVKGKRVLLDASSLESIEQQDLPKPPSCLVGADTRVFVEAAGEVVCLDAAAGRRELKPLWKLPLTGTRLVGTPILFNEQTVVALEDGRVLFLDSTGKESRRIDLDVTLGLGPTLSANRILVGGVDGSLFQVSP